MHDAIYIYIYVYITAYTGRLWLLSTLDTQCTCVFVLLLQGVEKTLSTVVEVIQKVKDTLMEEDIEPKDCFVSLEVKWMH